VTQREEVWQALAIVTIISALGFAMLLLVLGPP
jgi:hypothetical protein